MKRLWMVMLILLLAIALSGCGNSVDTLESAITGAFDKVESGFDKLESGFDKVEDIANRLSGGAKKEPTPDPEPTPAPEEPELTPAPDVESTPEEAAVSDSTVRPEIKEALDQYEAFFAEYAEFMQKYAESDNSLGMMADYLSMMQQYTETMESFDAMEDMEMTTAEAQYYAEVSLRISQNLLAAAG